ncbi:hypothetical protein HAX54_007628, partial [Datura stramonium]|nr:hypothetical protein [Datura stramonium]
ARGASTSAQPVARSSSRIGAMLSAAWQQHAHTARREALLLSRSEANFLVSSGSFLQ